MAKADTTIDEELYDGLQQARKKKPRYYALIAKGADVVGLIVQKKKINDGMAAKAKAEAKGNNVILGVCHGQGVELTFEVVGTVPTIKPIKIKEFIAERTELTLKPNWAVVTALKEVQEEDEVPPAPPVTGSAQPQTPPAPSPTAPPAPGDPLADLSAKMKQLTPAVQAAIVANPARKTDLLEPVAAFQSQIKAKDAAAAQQSLLTVAKLVKELAATAPAPPGTTTPVAPPTPPPPQPTQTATETPPDSQYSKAKAKFAAARGNWIKVRDQAVANIHAIRDAMVAKFKDVPELKDNLARGAKELTEVAAKFNDDLKKKFDEFTADPPPPVELRDGIKRDTLALIDAYRQEIESNSLFEDLDQREFAPVLVKAPLLKVLTGLAKDLA